MAHAKHEAVRRRFAYRCGYCGVTEENSGGELTVDHYRPISAGGSDHDDNLVYACIRCNQYKSDFWHSDENFLPIRRILHPILDDITAHLRETEDGTLQGLTETGRFHISLLQLNRSALIAYRRKISSDTRRDISV